MVQQVVAFPAELDFVALHRKTEVLLHVGVEHEAGRPGYRISCRIPELVDGLKGERGRIEPSLRGRRIQVDRLTGGVRAVGIDVGVGVVVDVVAVAVAIVFLRFFVGGDNDDDDEEEEEEDDDDPCP